MYHWRWHMYTLSVPLSFLYRFFHASQFFFSLIKFIEDTSDIYSSLNKFVIKIYSYKYNNTYYAP